MIFLSEYPEVKCVCASCDKEYLIYDVSFYPAAVGYDPERGNFNKYVSKKGTGIFKVIALWSYPDDPEDPNDDNDVDWFNLIAVDSSANEYVEVVNDETA